MKFIKWTMVAVLLQLTSACGGTLPANVKAVKAPGNVAFQARATASSSYTDPIWALNFEPSAAVDGITFESHQPETFWLLPNFTTGNLAIDPEGTVKIDRMRILNTHNSGFNDAGTKDFHVDAIGRDGKATTVWTGHFSRIGESLEKILPGIFADRVIVYVDSYFGMGGGLNEVEISAAGRPPRRSPPRALHGPPRHHRRRLSPRRRPGPSRGPRSPSVMPKLRRTRTTSR